MRFDVVAPEPTKRGNAKRLVPAPSVLGPCACGLAYGGIVKAMLWPFERGAARLLPPLPFVHGDEGVALGLVFVVVALAIASVPAFLLFRLRSYSAQVAFVVGMLFFVDAGSLMELPTGLPGSFGWIVTLGPCVAALGGLAWNLSPLREQFRSPALTAAIASLFLTIAAFEFAPRTARGQLADVARAALSECREHREIPPPDALVLGGRVQRRLRTALTLPFSSARESSRVHPDWVVRSWAFSAAGTRREPGRSGGPGRPPAVLRCNHVATTGCICRYVGPGRR